MSSTLRRRTPLRRKAVRRGKPKRAACSYQRCHSRVAVAGLCLTHATRRADQLVGDHVKARDGGCVVAGPHNGPLQWSHLVSRRYRAVRWMPENSVGMCAGHHRFFTDRPLEFEAWIVDRMGAEAWAALKARALEGPRVDVADVIAAFKEAA